MTDKQNVEKLREAVKQLKELIPCELYINFCNKLNEILSSIDSVLNYEFENSHVIHSHVKYLYTQHCRYIDHFDDFLRIIEKKIEDSERMCEEKHENHDFCDKAVFFEALYEEEKHENKCLRNVINELIYYLNIHFGPIPNRKFK